MKNIPTFNEFITEKLISEDFLVCTGDKIEDFLNEIKPKIHDDYEYKDGILKFIISGDEQTVNKYKDIAKKSNVTVKFEG
jgi:hypothetical protein